MSSESALQANIRKYYAFHFFLNFQLWFPIWIIYLTEERGLTLGQVTLIDVPFWLCIVFLQIPAAGLADRFGRKPVLVASAAVFGLAVVAFGLASTFPLLLLSYLIWGVGFALLFGTESAFIFDTLKAMGREDEYPQIYGRGWGVAIVAQMAGTLIGAPVAEATSLVFPIVLSGGIAAIGAVVAMTFVEPLAAGERKSALPYGQILRDSAQIVRTNAPVRYSILFYGVLTIGSIAPIFFFQPFLVDHDVSLGAVGFWQAPARIAGIVAALSAHMLMRRMGERWVFLSMPLMTVASFALLATWDSVWAQIAFPVLNFAAILSQPTVTDYLNKRVGSEQRATVVSLTNLIRSAVLIPVAPLMGALAEESLSAAFIAGGLMVGVLSVPLMLAWFPFLGRAPRGAPELAGATPGRD